MLFVAGVSFFARNGSDSLQPERIRKANEMPTRLRHHLVSPCGHWLSFTVRSTCCILAAQKRGQIPWLPDDANASPCMTAASRTAG
jgi:hypothetical protein